MANTAGDQPRKSGRPLGTGAVAQLRRQLLAGGEFSQFAAAVWKAALAGDVGAQKLLADRMVPAYRTQVAEVEFQLPAGSLSDKALALLEAAASGELPADVAADLIRSVAAVVSIEEGDELRKRLDALTFGDLA